MTKPADRVKKRPRQVTWPSRPFGSR
jgi:hypothetical protein